MRLLSTKSRAYKDKEYRKSFIILPNKLLEKLGWKTGEDLEAEAKQDKLIITKNDKIRVDLIEGKR
ncbi:hypothetical protein HYV85_00165 [Candidatus Woesearchaeota archaeon]|nr:hypothetical protein [Candidatus Woesearchaeota archaeon]